jgi:hypothetical protein
MTAIADQLAVVAGIVREVRHRDAERRQSLHEPAGSEQREAMGRRVEARERVGRPQPQDVASLVDGLVEHAGAQEDPAVDHPREGRSGIEDEGSDELVQRTAVLACRAPAQ